MGERKIRPSGWIYVVTTLIPLFGCLIAIVMTYWWFPGLPGILGSEMKMHDLTQVVVPGSEDISFAKSGACAVYYEYRSVVDGVVYTSSDTPPILACTLTSKTTGADVAVVPDYVKTNNYSYRARAGVLIRSITIDEPGTYTFSCRNADGRSEPEFVLAVGPNFVWEFFGIAARIFVTVAAGLGVLLISTAVVLIVVIVISVKRNRSKKIVAAG
jgi:hypothetical protein